jgi:negative regulator of flagellin synthesis FlgM
MTIEGLGPTDPISKYNKTEKPEKPSKTDKKDSIHVSAEAKSMGEIYKASEEVKNIPDVRQDRIDEVKEKLKDPSYINDRIIDSVANSIMESFNI